MSVPDLLLLPFEFIIVGSLAWWTVMLTRVAIGDIVEAMARKRVAGDRAIDEEVIIHAAGAGPNSLTTAEPKRPLSGDVSRHLV